MNLLDFKSHLLTVLWGQCPLWTFFSPFNGSIIVTSDIYLRLFFHLRILNLRLFFIRILNLMLILALFPFYYSFNSFNITFVLNFRLSTWLLNYSTCTTVIDVANLNRAQLKSIFIDEIIFRRNIQYIKLIFRQIVFHCERWLKFLVLIPAVSNWLLPRIAPSARIERNVHAQLFIDFLVMCHTNLFQRFVAVKAAGFLSGLFLHV